MAPFGVLSRTCRGLKHLVTLYYRPPLYRRLYKGDTVENDKNHMTLFHQKIPVYDPGLLAQGIEAAAQAFGGAKQLLSGRERILLKPNLLGPGPAENHHMTHPPFILAVVDWLLDQGVTVSLADSPAYGTAESCIAALELSEPLKRRGVEVFSFSKVRYYKANLPKFRRLSIAAEPQEFDGMINLPKLKAHCQCHFSGAVKNLYGCVVGKRKPARHMTCLGDEAAFAAMLNANAAQAGAFWHLADGLTVPHKDGPMLGEPYPLGSLLAADDPQELDWAFCRLVNLDPMTTEQFQAAGPQAEPQPVGEPLVAVNDWQVPKKVDVFFNPVHVGFSVAKQLLTYLKLWRRKPAS